MAILRFLGKMIFTRFLNDRQFQTKVKSVIKDEVVPLSQKGWERVKPELEKTAQKVKQTAKNIKKNIDI